MRNRPFCLCLLLLLSGCRAERASGPLRQGAYVWQRNWTPAVRESVQQARGFADLVVLAAEMDLQNPRPRVIRIPLDGEVLKGRPVGAAVRLSALPSLFAQESRIVRLLESLIREVAAEARAKDIALSEIQIDYDCPDSKLADYRDILPALRRAASPLPLTITTLPTWMRQRRPFRTLIEGADGYVLQLHSLPPPVGPGEELDLIEADSARGWVEKAARFGHPFRVALPTYSYIAAFDAENNFLGFLTEGPLLSWSKDVKVRRIRSDPAALAGLIRGWTRDRPAELAGVLWYRLPVAGERLNWSLTTLQAVKAGRAPRGTIRFLRREPESGLVEIDLLNAGEAETAWPAAVRIRWRGKAPIAADGLAVYRMAPAREGEILLQGSGAGLLQPGARRAIAWLRFATRTEVEVELP